MQLRDLPIQPEEEKLKKELASLQKEFNSSKDFRSRLNLLMESVSLKRNQVGTAEAGGRPVGGGDDGTEPIGLIVAL